jgi:hypothetical protein
MSEARASVEPAASAAFPPAEYELSDDQRESVRSLAASMSFVGACLMLFGVLLASFAFIALYAGFPLGAVGLFVVAAAYTPTAWWTMSGGRSLAAVPRTRGRDIHHLMEAVQQLFCARSNLAPDATLDGDCQHLRLVHVRHRKGGSVLRRIRVTHRRLHCKTSLSSTPRPIDHCAAVISRRPSG